MLPPVKLSRSGGRPSLGPRRALTTRVSPQIADAVEVRAAQLRLTVNDYLAAVIARELGLEAPPAPTTQEALPVPDAAQ